MGSVLSAIRGPAPDPEPWILRLFSVRPSRFPGPRLTLICLPQELVYMVTSYLDPVTICCLAVTCKRLYLPAKCKLTTHDRNTFINRLEKDLKHQGFYRCGGQRWPHVNMPERLHSEETEMKRMKLWNRDRMHCGKLHQVDKAWGPGRGFRPWLFRPEKPDYPGGPILMAPTGSKGCTWGPVPGRYTCLFSCPYLRSEEQSLRWDHARQCACDYDNHKLFHYMWCFFRHCHCASNYPCIPENNRRRCRELKLAQEQEPENRRLHEEAEAHRVCR